MDNGNSNFWNNSLIGNYWDNYTGIDANDDGIGDTPHSIVGSAMVFDYLPIWDDGDDLGPSFSIISPSIDSYHNDPPTIQLDIPNPSDVDSSWYTIIGSGDLYLFIGDNFEVNFTSWTNQLDGSITIRVYANDSLGNIAFNEISLNKDTIDPVIVINDPTESDLFGDVSPFFNFTITELNVDQLWFRINDSSTDHFILVVSGNNEFSLDSSIWDALPDGYVQVSFHVNDTAGNLGTVSIDIIKDTTNPQIIILSPLGGAEFGDTAPTFNLTITELHLSQLWFKINDSSENYFVSAVTGNSVFSIDSSIWDALPDGSLVISFYVNDTLGHMGAISVTIIKDTSISPPNGPPAIPGYDLTLMVITICIISIVFYISRKKFLNK